jgi:hypothetical protein
MTNYGHAPETIGTYDLDFTEYMHFMYLPIVIPGTDALRLPDRLAFATELIADAIMHEVQVHHNSWDYVYVTSRRGYATPGNPLNRPGWHADGFGTPDVNYVWTDRFPTLFAVQDFGGISPDHVDSIAQFEAQIDPAKIRTYGDKELHRLDPFVIHAAPEIPAPGGERSFFKVSFSNDRYNLLGNSHNYLLDYDWPMFDRSAVRNDPAHASSDGMPL